MNVESVNRRVFGLQRVARAYSRWHALFPSEERIFREYAGNFAGRVLDVAMGAGRTTAALFPRARRYVGLDLSEAMVAGARERHPEADLRVMDMRVVPAAFAGEVFDAILIAFNGIDCVEWSDRNDLLAGLRGLLGADGVLVFSTHSLDVAQTNRRRMQLVAPELLRPRALQRPRDWLKGFLYQARWTVRSIPNRMRNRRLERHFDGYAYLNDSGEAYSLLTCFVSEAKQRASLESMGYRVEQVIGGAEVRSEWHYFICRRVS
jgi:SAM-dependent methyltransferase